MIIKETRWKCDYCGVVSPVIEEGEKPSGWVTYQLPDITTRAQRWEKVYTKPMHFCRNGHLTAWSKESPIEVKSINDDGTIIINLMDLLKTRSGNS